MKRSRIALFGIFGVQNLGNECTLQAILHHLRQRLQNAEIYAICYGPQDTLRRYQLAAIQVSSGYSLNATLRPPRGTTMKILRRLFVWPPTELLHLLGAIKTLRGTHLVLMTGTGMLTDYSTWAFGFPYDILKWTIAARVAGCRVRFVGVGVGPLHQTLSRYFVKLALYLADYRSYRDIFSKTRIQQYGYTSTNDPVFPDLAFSLPTALFPKHNNHERHPCVVGVGVMDHFIRRGTRHSDHDALYRAYLEKMSDFICWLLEHGHGIRILVGDLRCDATVKRDLREALHRRGIDYQMAPIADDDIYSVEDLLDQIASTDLVVSPRYHNLLLAIMLNKPVISLSYDPKNDYLLDGVGLGKYCQPLDRLEVHTLIDQFVELSSCFERLKPVVCRTTEKYRRLLDAQYAQITGDL